MLRADGRGSTPNCYCLGDRDGEIGGYKQLRRFREAVPGQRLPLRHL